MYLTCLFIVDLPVLDGLCMCVCLRACVWLSACLFMGLCGAKACAGRFLADHLEQGSVNMQQVLYDGETSCLELGLVHSRGLHWLLIPAWLTPAIALCLMEE